MNNRKQSLMLRETLDIPAQVDMCVHSPLPVLPIRPGRVYTLGRGSSDHAALVVHHLLGRAGVPSTGLALSLVGETIDIADSLYLLISQSGASPDMCEAARKIRSAGCSVLSLVNHDNSRLSEESNFSISQYAGDEIAVAATKSVICSILAGAKLAEHWGATPLDLESFAGQVEKLKSVSVRALADLFVGTSPILVVGRGSGYGIACEIALKLQELLGRPAMAYSSSEVLHGPAGMVQTDYPVLALAVGPERSDVLGSVEKLRTMGAKCQVLETSQRHDALAATLMLCHVYVALEAACQSMGLSPDKPRNLNKVTLTE